MNEQIKIGEWLGDWFEIYAKPVLEPSTISIYADARWRINRDYQRSIYVAAIRYNRRGAFGSANDEIIAQAASVMQ